MSRYRPAPEPWTRVAIPVVRGIAALASRPDYRHRTGVPHRGGLILAANHISNLDPVLLARFVLELGRIPRFLAKNSLFERPVLGDLLRGAGQIPVYRQRDDAANALRAAIAALRRDELVVIYPEGTTTSDPDGWPMLARTGVARLALATGVPVLPVAQWGVQDVVGPGLRLRHRRRFAVSPAPALDLVALSRAHREKARADGQPVEESAVLRSLTATVMTAIRGQLAELRGEPVPELVWDPRRETRTRIEAVT